MEATGATAIIAIEARQERKLHNPMMMRQTSQEASEQQSAVPAPSPTIVEQPRHLDRVAVDGSNASARFWPWLAFSAETSDGDAFGARNLNREQIFHPEKTELPGEGREALLVHAGARDDLAGDPFAE